MDSVKLYFLLTIGIFHCFVSLPVRIAHETHTSNEKTLVHCCIQGIILPIYTGIKITHYMFRNPINQHVIGILGVPHQDLPKYAVIGEYSGEVKDYVRSPKKDWTIGAACCWVSTVNEKLADLYLFIHIIHILDSCA